MNAHDIAPPFSDIPLVASNATGFTMSANPLFRLPRELMVMTMQFPPPFHFVDGSWHMPNTGRSGWEEYRQRRIHGASFFDIDKVASPSPYPHMLPTPVQFAEAMREQGCYRQSRMIVYDSSGITTACRTYWTFQVFGQPSSILAGGLPAWETDVGHVDTEPLPADFQRHPSEYEVPEMDMSLVSAYEEIVDLARRRAGTGAAPAGEPLLPEDTVVIDARTADRFWGRVKEPRPIPSGHIPGSINVPFAEVLRGGMLKSETELREIFQAAGLDTTNPPEKVVCTCGSGVTASILWVALRSLGIDASVYDGSWSEYAARSGSVIRTEKETFVV